MAKERIISTVVILIIVVIILIIIWYFFWRAIEPINQNTNQPVNKDVTIKTDKTEYQRGEEVKITITNNTDQEIYFRLGFIEPFTSFYLEQYKNGKWDTYRDAYGAAELPIDYTPNSWLKEATIVKPNEKYEHSWYGGKGEYQEQKIELVDPGKYRIKLGYYYKQSNEINWEEFNSLKQSTYSNEFTLEKKIVHCVRLEQDIKQKIEEANYCQAQSDCTISTEFTCPFGSYQLFNKKANLSGIKSLVNAYNNDCYRCLYKYGILPTLSEIICENNKCVKEKK